MFKSLNYVCQCRVLLKHLNIPMSNVRKRNVTASTSALSAKKSKPDTAKLVQVRSGDSPRRRNHLSDPQNQGRKESIEAGSGKKNVVVNPFFSGQNGPSQKFPGHGLKSSDHSFNRARPHTSSVQSSLQRHVHNKYSTDEPIAKQLSNLSFNRDERKGSGSSDSPSRSRKKTETIGTGIRSWQSTAYGEASKKENNCTQQGFMFKLMSYNVLAQNLLEKHPELYRQIPGEHLQWEFRWRNLLREFKQHNCDILCLQEVQEEHMTEYFQPQLKALGYASIFKRITGGLRTDGCAIFYKERNLRVVEHASVEYKQPNSRLLDRNNVALIAKFAHARNHSLEFIVGTTHLLYNPKRFDVRLAQLQLFLTEIERMAYSKSKTSKYLPIIICGDLNAVPSSPELQFLYNAYVNYRYIMGSNQWIPQNLGVTDNCQHLSLISLRNTSISMSRKDEMALIQIRHTDKTVFAQNMDYSPQLFNTGFLRHNFHFNSAYEHKNGEEATTFQMNWITVDYILYSALKSNGVNKEDKLKLLSRYQLPIRSSLKGVKLPNQSLGSDHISLVAKFKLEP